MYLVAGNGKSFKVEKYECKEADDEYDNGHLIIAKDADNDHDNSKCEYDSSPYT